MENKSSKLDTVKYSKIKKVLNNIEEKFEGKDIDISFEFIAGSFFPEIMDNIRKTMAREYINGYNEGNRDKCKEKYYEYYSEEAKQCFNQIRHYLELARVNIETHERTILDDTFYNTASKYDKENFNNMKELLKYSIECCNVIIGEEI